MYFAQTTKERIKLVCKKRNINAKQMLSDCSLGANAIQQINDTKGMASFSLAKIADYLEIIYLVEPIIQKLISSFITFVVSVLYLTFMIL